MKYTLLFIVLLYFIYFILYNKHANEEFINLIDSFKEYSNITYKSPFNFRGGISFDPELKEYTNITYKNPLNLRGQDISVDPEPKEYANITYKNPLNLSGGISVDPELKGNSFTFKALQIENILIDKQKLRLLKKLPFTCPGGMIYSNTCQGGCKGSNICLNDECIDSEDLKNLNTFWPIGTIITYFNILKDSEGNSKIPEGWAVCDDTKGTPDLRDKFIVGAGGEYNVGKEGGSKYVTVDRSQVPNHSHRFASLGGQCIGKRDLKPTERNRLTSGTSSLIGSSPLKRSIFWIS